MDIPVDKIKGYLASKPLSFYLALAAGAYLVPKAVSGAIELKKVHDTSSSASSLKNIEKMMQAGVPMPASVAAQPRKDNYPYY